MSCWDGEEADHKDGLEDDEPWGDAKAVRARRTMRESSFIM
jgi:hypothetical protein